MVKFGDRPIRSLDSFGVVGLLGEEGKVYYDSIFTSRHIGRVSDLLIARLKGLGQDELRFRIILMFSLYEAYRAQLRALAMNESDSLPEPVVIECGVDSEKIAIGVSFSSPTDEPIAAETLSQRVSTGALSNRIERFVAQMYADSDQVVVRIQPEARRVEVVSMLALPGKLDSNSAKEKERSPVEVVELKPESKASALKAEYIELGDIDYAKLLKADAPGAATERPATGEILAKGTAELEEENRVSGKSQSDAQVTRISGVTQHLSRDGEELKVPGGRSGASSAATSPRFSDSEAEDELLESDTASEAEIEAAKKRLTLYRNRISRLQSKIETLEGLRQNERVVVRGPREAPAETDSKRSSSIAEMIKGLFRRKRDDEFASPDEVPSKDPSQDAGAHLSSGETTEDAVDPITGKILREQVERLEETIARMRKEAQQLKGEVGNTRAQKWADGMVGELLAEKARIGEMAKRLNVSVRQKELEFKNRETVLNEELRRKEEQLRQKSYGLDRAKEQISQMTMAIERSKSQQQGSSEEGQLKQKLSFTQKLLQGAKDENAALAKKVDELKNQLMSAQSASASKPRGSGDGDLAAIKAKYERSVKQNDEFKRANQLLMEKLNEIQKPKPGSMSNDELKKKLETAMRIAATHQKDAEQLRLKVEELQKEEARLKGEMNRANNALRAMKASAAAKGQRGNDDPNGSQAA